MSASLAAPSTGGAVSLILMPPSSITDDLVLRCPGLDADREGRCFGAPYPLACSTMTFTAAFLEVNHLQVHLDHLLDVLQESGASAASAPGSRLRA